MLQQATGESLEGLGQAVFMVKGYKKGVFFQSSSSKFIGLTMERDSWQMSLVRSKSWSSVNQAFNGN